MRNLLVMVGSPASGKSTWIKENNLEEYSVSPDTLRLIYSAPEFNEDGYKSISQKNDKDVWNILDTVLEKRMSKGEFTIVDATHTRDKYLRRYKDLCDKYRYRMYVKRFDVALDVLLHRNSQRTGYKRVPDDVIRLHHERLKTLSIPKSMNQINNFSEVNENIRYTPCEYKKVCYIGDVHGTLEPLQEFMSEHYSDDTLFVFLGDYIDRGSKNRETIKYLIELSSKPNFIFLEGNHERWLWYWANDETQKIRSREFILYTKPQFEEGLSKEELESFKRDVRMFYRKIRAFVTLDINGTKIFACHGGVNHPYPTFISTEQLINGVGLYESLPKVYQTWHGNNEGVFLVHGHRNIQKYPIISGSHTFNLDGGVEFGGSLRALTFDGTSFFTHEYKNNNYIPREEMTDKEERMIGQMSLIERMRASRHIDERIMGDISSFNFKRSVFSDKTWNSLTVKARGLFINNKTNQVVARSYNKFFNYQEMESTSDFELAKNMKFPAVVYQKHNGFLGIIGYDNSTNSVLFCSKSTVDGPFAEIAKEIISAFGNMEIIESIVSQGYSMVVEVIDPKRDPHIIEYKEPKIVLLDIIKNSIEEYEKIPFEKVVQMADKCGFEHKEYVARFNDFVELSNWMKDKIENDTTEGFVVEDSSGFMFKIKTNYYKKWKTLRGQKDRVFKDENRISDMAFDEVSFNFLNWCKTQDPEYIRKTDIISLRNKYIDEQNTRT